MEKPLTGFLPTQGTREPQCSAHFLDGGDPSWLEDDSSGLEDAPFGCILRRTSFRNLSSLVCSLGKTLPHSNVERWSASSEVKI